MEALFLANTAYNLQNWKMAQIGSKYIKKLEQKI